MIGPDPDGTGTHNKFRAMQIDYNSDGQPTAIKQGTATGATDWSTFQAIQELDSDYDGIGRKTRDTLKFGSSKQAMTDYSYDPGNRFDCKAIRLVITGVLPATACDSDTTLLDRITKFNYNAADQVTKVKTGLNTPDKRDETTFTYTDNGLVATLADGLGNLTTYTYDGLDRLKKVQFPSKTTPGVSSTTDFEQYGYVPNTALADDIRRRDNSHIGYGYDNLGRLSSKDAPGTTTYGYDLIGHMTSAANSSQTLTFDFDALGRNTNQSTTFNGGSTVYNVGYKYDDAGNRIRITWPDSTYVVYDYDPTGAMIAVRENGATSGVRVLATYTYDDLGRRDEINRGNGVTSDYGYTGVWLSSLLQAVDAPKSQTLTFQHNPAGQVTSRTSNNDAYAWTGGYNFDRLYTANGLNQLTTAGSASLSYDDLGNLTSDGAKTYVYNNQNQLTSVTGVGSLSYDPVGRLSRTTGSATKQYLYDGSNLIAEYNGAGTILLRRYVPGPDADEPLVWYEGSDVTSDRRWLIADPQGSITAVTDQSGAAIAVDSYDEYGIPGSSNAGAFQYTGQRWLADFGVYYYKARIYSPDLGRFLQANPVGYDDGMNLYAYVGNDPVNAVDPSGLDCKLGLAEGPCSDDGTTVDEAVVKGKRLGIFYGPKIDRPDTDVGIVLIDFKIVKTAPPDAMSCNAGGITFKAPPNFDPRAIVLSGQAWGLIGASSYVGHGGKYDFQRVRSGGNTTFYRQYTPVANMAVGFYLAGAGYTRGAANVISDSFAHSFSSNGATAEQDQYRNLAYDILQGKAKIECHR